MLTKGGRFFSIKLGDLNLNHLLGIFLFRTRDRKSGARKLFAIGELGFPNDIANLVAWLAAVVSKFVTGTTVTTDDGHIRS